ncbi:MAG TPA: hypothetical protein VGQ83_24835 [Polyangia bacterium]|jgi:hypothetical protein
MRRLGLCFGAAAAALALGLAGCPLMHDAYPPSSKECQTAADCYCGETCGAEGTCVPDTSDGGGCAVDAGTVIPDGGRRG